MSQSSPQEGPDASQALHARFGKIGHATTRSSDSVGEALAAGGPDKASASSNVGKSRTIRTVTNFGELYDMGKEVMPSTHSYMKVNFGTRKKDGLGVVIKVRFKPNCFRSREDERSWRHNTEFLLNMPNMCGVAKLYEVLEDSKAFYVVMEKVSGQDLFETIEAEGKVGDAAARAILIQLFNSMVHLHSHNAVHKDLKLENVMYNNTYKTSSHGVSGNAIKVIDFDTLEEWTPSSPVSKDVVGTDQYISQEAYSGKYSPLSDMFAAGVMAYRLMSGRFPFHDGMFDDEAGENYVGSPKMAQIRRRLKVAKVNFEHSAFKEHPEACDLVMRLLAYDTAHRPTARAALQHPWLRGDAGRDADGAIEAAGDELIDDGIIIAD